VNLRLAAGMTFAAAMVCAVDAYSCKTAREVSNVVMIRESDAIVRVSAEDYAFAPKAPTSLTGINQDSYSRIRFKVLEVIRGKTIGELVLPGVLVDADDFNEFPPPYTEVRPDGRRGSCFASSYRSAAQYLLMLKQKPDGGFTTDWYPLAPVNEQLHSSNDPWLLWVRKEAKAHDTKSASH
jgi:hypothetical protein